MAKHDGFVISADEVNPHLLPHQRDCVIWAVQGGRRALFEQFGLGKTVQQLEIERLILARAVGRGLIVTHLGVRQEFQRDAVEILGWPEPPKFIRSITDASETGIYLTNYETIRDGKLDPRYFNVVSLDEGDILRGFGGTKTFRECMRLFAGDGKSMTKRERSAGVPFRFVATATPSPNELLELAAYAAFLGVMEVSDVKSRFFKRDSTKADNLTLHPHKEAEFWAWVASWALVLQKPSDLSPQYSDEGYKLPPLEVCWHEIPTDYGNAGAERDGQMRMFPNASFGVVEASRERRTSLPARIAKMLEIRAQDPGAHRIIWHDLEGERKAIEEALPSTRYDHWEEFRDGHTAAIALYARHYSARPLEGRELICGPGEKLVLLTPQRDALFAWRKFIDDAGQTGINCAVFRNEGPHLSSNLILEAMAIAWRRWPGERLYTYVDPESIQSPNPGYCFLCAGWRRAGETQAGLLVLEAMLGTAIVPKINVNAVLRTVYGSQDLEEREQIIADFKDGKFSELAAKPVMLGSGTNLQKHCHQAVYLGVSWKFKDFIQSVHRLQRYLQKRAVRIDLIYTEAERDIRRDLERKWAQHNDMVAKMTKIIREHGLSQASMIHALTRTLGVARCEVLGERFRLVNNDCVDETKRMEPNSVDLIVTSIPFATQYSYSPRYEDFGHTDTNEHFFQQMDFLTPELLRVLKPGRLAAIHVKDRIVPGGMTGLGMQTVYPFHAVCIDHYVCHGFAFMGMKTIVTDVVRENNQTYRLGWSEQCKDGTKMGVGMSEYLLLFRKAPTDTSDSYANEPVTKTKPLCRDADGNAVSFDRRLPIIPGSPGYSRSRWQIDAHGFTRSSGNRPITARDFEGVPHDVIFKLFRDYHLTNVYDFEHHVLLGEELEARGILPTTFMLLQPPSWHPDVWSDVTRMLTLNGAQSAKGKEMHLCLARDSSVLTKERGYVAIQDVNVGEHALTHKGRWRRVQAVRNTGVQPVIRISTHGVPGLTLTPDHKLWIRKSDWAREREGAERAVPDWVEAQHALRAYVNLKLPDCEPTAIEDQQIWWIVGRWLADGHWESRGAAIISVGSHKKDAALHALGSRAGGMYSTRTAHQIRVLDPDGSIKSILEQCGHGAGGKRLPPEAFTLPPKQARALLDGYLSGDGHCVPSRERWMCMSISRDLLLGLAMLVQRVFGTIASVYPGREPRESVIEGRVVHCQQEWVLSFEVGACRTRPFIADDGAWKKVRSIAGAGEAETWCLRVEEDESFTAEGCIVKNCPLPLDLVSRAITQYSMEGELVYDPFVGLGTTVFQAIKLKRQGLGVELSTPYFLDAAAYCKAAELEVSMPDLFAALEREGMCGRASEELF